MSIADRILQLRTSRNMSQNQLAKAMEVSRQAVSKWENGQSTPDATKMILLCEVLDTDLEYLTTGRRTTHTPPPAVSEVVVEKVVEKVVEVPVVEFVDMPVVQRVVRTRYRRNPLAYATIGIVCFLLGFLFGILI